MPSQTLFKPYSETVFSLDADASTLSVESPWVHAGFDVGVEAASSVSRVVSLLRGSENQYTDSEVQSFLQNFTDLPVLHALPRTLDTSEELTPYTSSGVSVLEAMGPSDFLETINVFDEIVIERDLSYMPKTWDWNPLDIAKVSAIENSELFDPFSAYTAIRAKRLNFQMQSAQDAHELITWLNKIKLEDSHAFYSAMADVLAQQYYVTSQCTNCLDPAIYAMPIISREIEKYSDEELHHDKLILQSIRHLSDKDPSEFAFMPEVKLEIEVIRHAAMSCALGFSALVSIMEGTVYPESDPVGDILKSSGRPESNKGVEAHFQINRKGNHTAIPESFIAKLPPVTLETIVTATRLAETTIRLDTGLSKSLFRYLSSVRS